MKCKHLHFYNSQQLHHSRMPLDLIRIHFLQNYFVESWGLRNNTLCSKPAQWGPAPESYSKIRRLNVLSSVVWALTNVKYLWFSKPRFKVGSSILVLLFEGQGSLVCLQPMGLQRVGYDWETEQRQCSGTSKLIQLLWGPLDLELNDVTRQASVPEGPLHAYLCVGVYSFPGKPTIEDFYYLW